MQTGPPRRQLGVTGSRAPRWWGGRRLPGTWVHLGRNWAHPVIPGTLHHPLGRSGEEGLTQPPQLSSEHSPTPTVNTTSRSSRCEHAGLTLSRIAAGPRVKDRIAPRAPQGPVIACFPLIPFPLIPKFAGHGEGSMLSRKRYFRPACRLGEDPTNWARASSS